MPQPGQYSDHRQRQHSPPCAATAAAEGNIDVVAEPGAQCDVPAAVKLTDRAGDIGRVKIAGHGQGKHLPQAHGHERIAGKVKVKLQAVAHCAQPGQRRGNVGKANARQRRPQRGERVSQKDLVTKPNDKQLKALLQIRAMDGTFPERIRHSR